MDVTDIDVVKIVANNTIFQKRWRLFCNVAKFKSSIIRDLEKLDNTSTDGFDTLVSRIMENWKDSAAGSVQQANIDTLCQLLKKIEAHGCVDALEKLTKSRVADAEKEASVNQEQETPESQQRRHLLLNYAGTDDVDMVDYGDDLC